MHSIQYNHIHTLFDIQLTAIKSLPCGLPQEIWMLWDGLHIRCNVRSDKFQLIVVEQGRPCWHVDCSDSQHVVVQGGAAFLARLGSTITRRFRTILSPELRHIVRVRWVEERGSHVTTATDNTNQSWSHRHSGHTVTQSEWSHSQTVHLYRPAMLRAAVLLLSLLLLARAQRNRQFEDEDQYGGNDVSRSSSDVGEFPYQRGERPIFNFDQGDEVSFWIWRISIRIIICVLGLHSDHTGAYWGSGQNQECDESTEKDHPVFWGGFWSMWSLWIKINRK